MPEKAFEEKINKNKERNSRGVTVERDQDDEIIGFDFVFVS